MDSEMEAIGDAQLEEAQEGYDEATFTDTEPADAPVPPFLKDISSLASWTVSSYKPGCGVKQLRDASPLQFWQSDGPQPHTLNVHFFKMVSIAHVRIYLDHSLDESYTPTKMVFLAGTGHHDLQLVCEMNLRKPKGWLTVDLSNAGGPPVLEAAEADDGGDDGEDTEDEAAGDDDEGNAADDGARHARRRARAARRRIAAGATLRCFLVQLQILENHQNGKDTHLRGLQIFAKDESYRSGGRARKSAAPAAPAVSAGDFSLIERAAGPGRSSYAARAEGVTPRRAARDVAEGIAGLRQPDWMGEPEWR